MNIEHELRSALRRESPDPGFSRRVLSRIEAKQHPWRAVAAAGLLTVVLGGWTAHAIVRQRQGERARDEVLLALRITSEKLSEAQSHVLK